jgi:hypothetical protein
MPYLFSRRPQPIFAASNEGDFRPVLSEAAHNCPPYAC